MRNCCVRVSQAILELATGRMTGRIKDVQPEIFLFVNVSEISAQFSQHPLRLLQRVGFLGVRNETDL